ncbi:polysaccharide biosynthesis protein [Soehngenia saccharolytica]|nr:polysaccharide biosynthesis protein [Soehngenia saccharolytica]
MKRKYKNMVNTERRDSNKEIKLGALVSYATIIFNILAGLIYTPWLIRNIGQSDYGLFILSTSIIGFFAMDFGLDGAVSRFVSKYLAEDNINKANDFLGLIYRLFIIIDIATFIVLLIVFPFLENIYIQLTPLEIEKLKVLYIITGLVSVISFPFIPLNGILVSYERFSFYKLTKFMHKVLVIVLMVVAINLGFGLYAVVLVNGFVVIVAIILKYRYIKRTTEIRVNIKYFSNEMFKQVIEFLMWSTVIILAERFIINITPTLLGAFTGSVQISIFSIGMTIEGYTYTFAQAINGLFLPKVSKMIAEKKELVDFEKLMVKVGRIQLFVSGIIIIGFIALGQEFIILWVGEGFRNSYFVAVFLILPYIVSLTQEIANTMLIAQNKVRYRAITTTISAVISIVLSVLLSPIYGAIGSAIAIFIGKIFGTVILMNIIYYKALKINIIQFFKECHFKVILPLFIVCIAGMLCQYLLPTDHLLILMLKTCFLMLLYFVLLWLFSFNEYEKNLLLSFLRRDISK